MNDDIGKTILAALGGIKPTKFAPGGIGDAKPARRKVYKRGEQTESDFLASVLAQFGVSPESIPPAAPAMPAPPAAPMGMPQDTPQPQGGAAAAPEGNMTLDRLMGKKNG